MFLSSTLGVLLAGLCAPGVTTIRCSHPFSHAIDVRQDAAKEFEARRAKIDSKDAAKLYALALWAERKQLRREARKTLRAVIKADPDHADARKALGYIQFGGKWVREKDLARLKKVAARREAKAKEAEMRKKGFVYHDGVWIKKEDLGWAKLGLVRDGSRWMRVADKKAKDEGKVMHPRTGEWIEAKDKEKADKGLFPIGGEWVDLAEANRLHKNPADPWVIRLENVTLITMMPLEKAITAANEAESAAAIARGLIFDPVLPLPRRVRIYAIDGAEAYREFSAQADETGFSAYGAFYATRAEGKPIAANYGEKNWGPYYLKHAAGMGVAIVLLEDAELEPTHWLYTAMGSYVERWSNTTAAKHFAPQYLEKGGVRNLKSFFKSFTISSEQAPNELEWNIYQAGILLSYLTKSPDKKTLATWGKVRKAIRERKGISKAIKAFEKRLVSIQTKLRDHLQQLSRG